MTETIDSRPARRPERVEMAGRLVRLLPLEAGRDANLLYQETHGAEKESLWRYMADGPFSGAEEFREKLEGKAASQERVYFAIVDRKTGETAGYASYLRIRPEHRVIEVGDIVYSPRLQKTAGATEAMYLMARHVFEELGYRRYEWKCDSANTPSRRAALRLGFRFEGIFRQHMIVKSRNRDTAWFAMLDGEWPQRKANFQRWLDASNFDAGGQQRLALSDMNRDREG